MLWLGSPTSASRLNLRVHLEGLSGSSAGAVNAKLLADGWMKGDRAGARRALLKPEGGKLVPARKRLGGA
ncbi:MAG: hypothetical protein ABI330_00360 [Caldimonas sp.]